MTLIYAIGTVALLSAACFAGARAIGRGLQAAEPDEHEMGGA